MKICVINGSPKGNYSITLQTSLYLEKNFPEHSFSFLNAGQKIKSFENDFSEAAKMLSGADLFLFSYPVYTFLAPSQLHRFIELMKASGIDFSGKFATQITTSKHFYDMTAHRYIEDNCYDMRLSVIHGLSADMDDLITEKGQKDAVEFMKYAAFCVNNRICEKAPDVKQNILPQYTSSIVSVEKKSCFDTVIVADLSGHNAGLKAMLDDFSYAYPYPTRLIDISEYPFSGGCLGCFNCAGDGKCIYKDGFDNFLREKIQNADALVYAFEISDHSMGSHFKTYDDRQFCNGHRTVTEGMPIGYVVFGDYQNEPNLQTVIEARCEVGHNFFAGVGFDCKTIESTAAKLAYSIEHGYVKPRNFYGVGGMKIFRDLIWVMRGLMKADHLYYKKHGIYDFPQKQRGRMLQMLFLGALVRNSKVKAKMGVKMNEGMIVPYKKVIDNVL